MGKILGWVKAHPWEGGILIFLGGLAILYLLGFFGGGASSSQTASGGDGNLADYLAAETQQTADDDAVQATQIQANAGTAQAGINAAANVDINNTWAAANTSTAEATDATEIATGNQTTQQDLIASLGAVANNLGTVLTNSKSSTTQVGYGSASGSSLFGLFGGGSSSSSGLWSSSSSDQTFEANQEQGAAVGLLGQIEQTEFHAGS